MNILMMTNTYLPHTGGVARSVAAFSRYYQQQGHKVLIVAPEFPELPENEQGVIRIPAIQRFNGSDFSVVLPVPHFLGEKLEAFEPDIVHSHHPFLIGSTARLVANQYKLPLVFTHHTMYEQYSHYVPLDSETLKRFVIKLATSYANMCDQVFAPSESVARILAQRKVQTPITIIPTGVDLNEFSQGDGRGFRAVMGIPDGVFLVGHLGRLAPEKNLEYLARAVVHFMQNAADTHFLVVGQGSYQDALQTAFTQAGLAARFHSIGKLAQPMLASAYKAMDVFVFSSQSETQGMVLTEAMAVSVPVIALDGPGAREVVIDHYNGRLLPALSSSDEFANAIGWFKNLPNEKRQLLRQAARLKAESCNLGLCGDNALNVYGQLLGKGFVHQHHESKLWSELVNLIEAEFDVLKGIFNAATAAIKHNDRDKSV